METPTTADAIERREIAPALGLLGPAGTRLAALMRIRPALAAALLHAPPRDIHARSAYIQRAYGRDDDPEEIAAVLSERHPRALLHDALGGLAHPSIYRLLDRACLPAWPLDAYAALDAALRGGVADILLERGCTFDANDARAAHHLLDEEPIVRRARRALARGRAPVSALADVVGFLLRTGTLNALVDLPDGAGRRALLRRLRRDVGALRSPLERDFPTPTRWRLIVTARELWHHGNRLNLCFGSIRGCAAVSHALALAAGRSIYLHHVEADAVAEVLFDFDGSAFVGEVRGASNARIAPALIEGLRDSLRQAGVHLTSHGVESALAHLLSMGAGGSNDEDDIPDLADAEDRVMVG